MFKGRIWERVVQKAKSRSLKTKLWIDYKNITQDIYLKLFLNCRLSPLNVQLTLVEISVSNKLNIHLSLFGETNPRCNRIGKLAASPYAVVHMKMELFTKALS